MSIYLEILHEYIKHASRMYRANFAARRCLIPGGQILQLSVHVELSGRLTTKSTLITLRIPSDTNFIF